MKRGIKPLQESVRGSGCGVKQQSEPERVRREILILTRFSKFSRENEGKLGGNWIIIIN
jgi:hypothetical protein